MTKKKHERGAEEGIIDNNRKVGIFNFTSLPTARRAPLEFQCSVSRDAVIGDSTGFHDVPLADRQLIDDVGESWAAKRRIAGRWAFWGAGAAQTCSANENGHGKWEKQIT